jgi:hypothetical protein
MKDVLACLKEKKLERGQRGIEILMTQQICIDVLQTIVRIDPKGRRFKVYQHQQAPELLDIVADGATLTKIEIKQIYRQSRKGERARFGYSRDTCNFRT